MAQRHREGIGEEKFASAATRLTHRADVGDCLKLIWFRAPVGRELLILTVGMHRLAHR